MAELVSDGSVSFLAGQDASKSPHDVSEAGYYSGVNVSVEQGVLKPRYGNVRLQAQLIFPQGGVAMANTSIKPYRSFFETGKFQGDHDYSVGADYFLVVVISGQIFFINEATLTVQHIPLEGEQLNPSAPRLDISPADRYLIITDFPAYPVIIDGMTARRADPDKDEIPPCVLAAYNQNRIVIANAGNQFTAGDPAGSTATPDAPLSFTEIIASSSPFVGQVFDLPTNYNNDQITAIGFLQVSDTSTGIGPLLVATPNAIYSYQTQLPRDQWAAGQFGSILVYNAGVAGPEALENLNSDMVFIDSDGEVRSIAMSRDEQGKWSKTPISREVRNWLVSYDKSLLRYSFATYFNNKIFISAYPMRVSAVGLSEQPVTDYAFAGFAVLELDNVSTLTRESPPAWAGLWTGLYPMSMRVVNKRCFVMSKDSGQLNALWEVRPDLTYDISGDSVRRVPAKVYTRDYEFQSPYQDKVLQSMDLMIQDVKGQFELAVSYKPGHSDRFVPWRKFDHNAPWKFDRAPFPFPAVAGHSFGRLNIGSPPLNECDPVSGQMLSTFREVQLELRVKGIDWRIRGFKINAEVSTQRETISACSQYKEEAIVTKISEDWNPGEFERCQTTT